MIINFNNLIMETTELMKKKNLSSLPGDFKHKLWDELHDIIKRTEVNNPLLKLNIFKMWTRNDKNFKNIVSNTLTVNNEILIDASSINF
jgi:hypothetical protein